MKWLIILLLIICLCKFGVVLKKIRVEYLILFCIINYNVEKFGK